MNELENESGRLDVFLVKRGFFRSRDRANKAVREGQIKVNGRVVNKPALVVSVKDNCEILQGDFNFVGRGALKLEAALDEWKVEVRGMVCLDIGVATGGFSDLLLQRDAAKVIGVDVGEGQIAAEVLKNKKFEFRNFTDATTLERKDFLEVPDLIVVDVSFVSVERFFAALLDVSSEKTTMLVLVKPQFETGRSHDGVIHDKYLIRKILAKIEVTMNETGLQLIKSMPCPVKGKKGNQEYWWMVRKAV